MLIAFITAFCRSIVSAVAAHGAEAGALRVGAARIDITPPGYARPIPRTSSRDPIYLLAIVVDTLVTRAVQTRHMPGTRLPPKTRLCRECDCEPPTGSEDGVDETAAAFETLLPGKATLRFSVPVPPRPYGPPRLATDGSLMM
jgi:hypothetical protein